MANKRKDNENEIGKGRGRREKCGGRREGMRGWGVNGEGRVGG